MKLPFELVYKIIDLCLDIDLDSTQDILKCNEKLITGQLVYLNYEIYYYILKNSKYNKLRLWKLLCQIPKEYKPIKLSVGINNEYWTLFDVEVRNERIGREKYENFLVLEERRRPKKCIKYDSYIEEDLNIIQYFPLNEFLFNLNLFTTNNLMSIWLWRRHNSFIKKDILNKNFRLILYTQQQSLFAWDRFIINKNGSLASLSENVLSYNTELFGRLL